MMPFAQIDISGWELVLMGLANEDYYTGTDTFMFVSGYSVVTFGLLYDCQEIWGPFETSLTTTWTVSSGGLFGDCVF